MSKKLYAIFGILIILAMILSSCQTTPTEEPQALATEAVSEPEETEAAVEPEGSKLILATTTSTQDSGLLDYLLPIFEADTGITVEVIAVGTGQALQLGVDGNADVLLVHSRAKEDEFMANGDGVRREDVMYNDFVIVGPASDPAGVKGLTSAVEAFNQIAAAEAIFISRGDESGTHTKELGIWKKAEIEPAGDWYVSAGQGMGDVLTMAREQEAYTLSDRATYLAMTKEGLDLVVLVEGDKDLLNPYGVIAVNPEKSSEIKNDLANQFIDWIISVSVQEKIGQFGVADFGAPLFFPSSALWLEANPPEAEAPAAAALKITGLVDNEMAWTEEEIKAMETMDVEYTDKDGEVETYTGVSLNALLTLAGVKTEATTIVFVADDGFTAEIALADLSACTDCIVAFRSDGGFRTVMPNFEGKLQVKGVVEIQVK